MTSYQQLESELLIGPLNSVESRNAPRLLNFEGRREILSTGGRLSIVGTRKPSEDALGVVWDLVGRLSAKGIVIVSGLASGIDTQAHKAAISQRGKTIAVLGTPLDEYYPRENMQLQRLIMKDHLAISQFDVGTKVQRSNFPARNRTMALISDATLIVEAFENSGTTHQGWEALRLGRPLYISSDLIRLRKLSWAIKMLDYGAHPFKLDKVDDLLESLPSRVNNYDSAVSF